MSDRASFNPRLIVFSDTTRASAALIEERFEALGRRARARSVLFTLRDYQLPVTERWALAEALSALCNRTDQGFGVADRADWALALRCSGFHMPQNGVLARDARELLGPKVFLSRGLHDGEPGPEPELDAVLLSPIFAARKGRQALGVNALERARLTLGPGMALFGLGGVAAVNAAACVAAGATGVAVIDAGLAPDPEPLLAALGILAP